MSLLDINLELNLADFSDTTYTYREIKYINHKDFSLSLYRLIDWSAFNKLQGRYSSHPVVESVIPLIFTPTWVYLHKSTTVFNPPYQ